MDSPAFTLRAPQNGTEYHIGIRTPADASAAAVAVIFMDGDDQFAPAIAAYETMRGGLPPLLLVGVGYGASYTKPANRRVRDYTPTRMATEAGSGGADAFLAFLNDTLWPELARRHRLREDVRGLAGHSLGSLLVVHALLQQPLRFNRLLASAPSLWWDDRAILCAAQKLQRTGLERPARLFLCAGEKDTESMLADLGQFEDQLRSIPFPKLEVESTRLAGRDHYDVLEDAFGVGLKALFAR